MAAGTDYPSPLSMLDGSHRKENVTVTKEEKSLTFESLKQPNMGKPPRHLSAMRYCVSSAQLAPATEVVRLISIICNNCSFLSFLHIKVVWNLMLPFHSLLRSRMLGLLAQSPHQIVTLHLYLFFALEAVQRSVQNLIWRMSISV